MKVTVCFDGEKRVVVPCDDGDITVDELKMRALIRYQRLFAKGQDIIIIHLRTKPDNAILDPTDPVKEVLDDKELVVAEIQKRVSYFENEKNYSVKNDQEGSASGQSPPTTESAAFQIVMGRVSPSLTKTESKDGDEQPAVKRSRAFPSTLEDGIPHPSGMKLIVEYSKQAAEIAAMKTEGIELPEEMKDNPYRCNVCNLRFKTVANLAAHSVAHVKDRPYKCQKCARSFSQVGNLEQHERSHGFRRTKVVECTVCGKTLRNPDNMKRHMYIHTGERPFECPHCQKGFRAKTDLKVHIRIHTGERPYKCNEDGCNRSFNDRSSFRRHKMVHNSIKSERERYLKAKDGDTENKPNIEEKNPEEHGATGLSFTEGGHEQNIEEENPDEIMDTESKTNEGQTNEHGELLFSPSMVSGESPVDAEPV